MIKLKTILFLIFFSYFRNYAQSKKDYIKELFVVMKQDSLMEQSGKIMVQSMVQQQQMMKKSHPDVIGKSTEKLDNLFNANIIIEKQMKMMKQFVKEDLVDIYDKHFTIEEIKDYINFYNSPSGQKFQKETPKIQNDTMMLIMTKYLPVLKKEFEINFEKMMDEKKNEMKLH